MSKETGGQAFPRQQWEYDGQNNVLQYQEEGMSLRDWMAGMALQGMMANSAMIDGITDSSAEWAANSAYKLADGMIAARSK